MDRAAFKEELSRRLAKRSQGFPEGNAQPTPSTSKDVFRSPNPQRKNTRTFQIDNRKHEFGRIRLKTGWVKCPVCKINIHFGKVAWRCVNCHAIVHERCQGYLPLPCAPVGPRRRTTSKPGKIADYAPTVPPMIPPLIIHCINAVELRGMTELGLYRLSGNKDRYEFLIQQFLKNDGALDLSEYDIPTITSALKQFLRSLSEPLVTYALRDTFIEAAMLPDARDRDVELGSVVMQLPQANLDTLAYLMLHLQRVSESEECKMPKSNLAKVFGPTLVGHSTGNLTPQSLIDEPKYQAAVVEALLNMPEEFWAKFIDPRKLQQRRLSELTRSQSSTQLSQLSRRPNLQGLSGSHALTPLSRPTEAAFKKRSSSDPEDLSRYGNEEIDQDDPVYENVNLRSQTVNQGQPELLYASLDLPVTNRTIKNQRNPAHAARTPWANRRFQQDEDEPLYASIMPTSNDNLYEDEPIHGEVFVGPNGEMYHKNVSF